MIKVLNNEVSIIMRGLVISHLVVHNGSVCMQLGHCNITFVTESHFSRNAKIQINSFSKVFNCFIQVLLLKTLISSIFSCSQFVFNLLFIALGLFLSNLVHDGSVDRFFKFNIFAFLSFNIIGHVLQNLREYNGTIFSLLSKLFEVIGVNWFVFIEALGVVTLEDLCTESKHMVSTIVKISELITIYTCLLVLSWSIEKSHN